MSKQHVREKIEDEMRKIQHQGEVTIPKEWRDEHDIDWVKFEERDDGALVIEPVL